MSEPFVGEIRLFAGNFPPRGWAFCDGQLLAVAENDTLFSLIGSIYGGDGRTTFALPDLRGRVPVHSGNGLSHGQKGGVESVTLTTGQIPVHGHSLMASADPASSPNPAAQVLAETISTTPYFDGPPGVPLSPQSIASTGGSQAHGNLQPFQCIHYIIALFGIYPSRT